MYRSNLMFVCLAAAFILSAACHKRSHLSLEPADPRPVYQVQVADADEAGLLVQELKIEPLRQEGPFLYFYGPEARLVDLKRLGYLPQQTEPRGVNYRVVEVRKKGSDAELMKSGVALLNRERGYWVVRGTLTELQMLERAGYVLRVLSAEPRPREILVRVAKREDVQRVAEHRVDIFSVQETRDGLVISGAAFDGQIDELEKNGFKVTRQPTVPPGGKAGGKK